MYVAKTKALISFAVTAKLICVFVFACVKCWFSHDAAQMTFLYISKATDCLIPLFQWMLFIKLIIILKPCKSLIVRKPVFWVSDQV